MIHKNVVPLRYGISSLSLLALPLRQELSVKGKVLLLLSVARHSSCWGSALSACQMVLGIRYSLDSEKLFGMHQFLCVLDASVVNSWRLDVHGRLEIAVPGILNSNSPDKPKQ